MKAKQRFGIEVDPSNLEFIFLKFIDNRILLLRVLDVAV